MSKAGLVWIERASGLWSYQTTTGRELAFVAETEQGVNLKKWWRGYVVGDLLPYDAYTLPDAKRTIETVVFNQKNKPDSRAGSSKNPKKKEA
jgi:hypothetical protein